MGLDHQWQRIANIASISLEKNGLQVPFLDPKWNRKLVRMNPPSAMLNVIRTVSKTV